MSGADRAVHGSLSCCKRKMSGFGRTSSSESMLELNAVDENESLGPKLSLLFTKGKDETKHNTKLWVRRIELNSQMKKNSIDAAFITVRAAENAGIAQWRLGRPRCKAMVSLSRFKLWWMRPQLVHSVAKVPPETQFLLGVNEDKLKDEKTLYSVFIPLLNKSARCSIRGMKDDTIHLVAETGCPNTPVHEFVVGLFVAVGEDPFVLIEVAMEEVKRHHANNIPDTYVTPSPRSELTEVCSNESYRRECELPPKYIKKEKKRDETETDGVTYPSFVEYFGWCTWDSCYTAVSQDLIADGLCSLERAGIRVRWMVLDDGWQSVSKVNAPNGQQWFDRLTNLQANHKFLNLRNTVEMVKEKFHVDHFFVWHAIQGYWQGVDIRSEHLRSYQPAYQAYWFPSGLLEVDPEIKFASLFSRWLGHFSFFQRRYGYGMIPAKMFSEFYNEYHKYLSDNGVDGVKVDAQSMMNCLGSGLGGSVTLNHAVHAALCSSVSRNFSESNVIHCMCHDNTILLQLSVHYGGRVKPVVRGSDDFYPRDQASHGAHLYANSFNALMFAHLGALQDWDMFQSHIGKAGEMHAASRAISGGPVYICDSSDSHNLDILRKLVLDDGSVLRPSRSALPTLKCLFTDPQHDAERPILGIWNVNVVPSHGVVGLFNIHGSRWCQLSRQYTFLPAVGTENPASAVVAPSDCHNFARMSDDEEFAMYACNSQQLTIRKLHETWEVATLSQYESEIVSITPLFDIPSKAGRSVRVAAVGLVDMYNAGGAVRSELVENGPSLVVTIRGAGLFLFICSVRPTAVELLSTDGIAQLVQTDYSHPIEKSRSRYGRLHVHLPGPFEGMDRTVRIHFYLILSSLSPFMNEFEHRYMVVEPMGLSCFHRPLESTAVSSSTVQGNVLSLKINEVNRMVQCVEVTKLKFITKINGISGTAMEATAIRACGDTECMIEEEVKLSVTTVSVIKDTCTGELASV